MVNMGAVTESRAPSKRRRAHGSGLAELRAVMLTGGEACSALDISDEWLRNLRNGGWITKQPCGRYRADELFGGYIRNLRDANRRASKSAASRRVQDARAQEIEMRVQERAGKLMATDEAIATVDEIVGLFLTRLSGFPARCTRDIGLRKVIDGEVFALRQELTEHLTRRAAELKAEAKMQPETKGATA
jgi:hypothetical protein